MGRPVGSILLRGVGDNRYLAFYHEAKGRWTRCGHVWYENRRWFAERTPGVEYRTRKQAGEAAGAARFERTEEEPLGAVSEAPEGGGPAPLTAGDNASPSAGEPPFPVGAVVRGKGRLAGYRGYPVDSCIRRARHWDVFVLVQQGKAVVSGRADDWELDVDG